MPWKVFIVRPTERAIIELRRFCWSSQSSACTGRMGYHDAEAVIGEEDFKSEWNGKGDSTQAVFERFPKDDPRWPKQCVGCGYVFQDGDQWQFNLHKIFEGERDGVLVRGVIQMSSANALPPGALWLIDPADKAADCCFGQPRPDGKHWQIMLPGGREWEMTGPSWDKGKQGPAWAISGTPPLVTAHPSINIPGRYHGFVQNGIVTDDCEGRKFDEMGRPVK